MAESSQSRALSREGSSSETRRPKPANSCPTWTRKRLLPQSARSPRNAWKRGRCCPLHVLVRLGPDVAFLCFVGLFIIAKWLTWFIAKWLIYAYIFTVHLIYQSTRLLEQTLLLIHTLFPSYRVSFELIRHPKIKLTTYSSFLSFSLRRLLTSSLLYLLLGQLQ
jgi:hypothetical protein